MIPVKVDFFENFKKIIPLKIRGIIIQQTLQSLLAPLQAINDIFITYVKKTRYNSSFNGQVIYLEHILNDTVDNLLRRIYITDKLIAQFDVNYIYYQIEQQPDDLIIYYKAETAPNEYLFYGGEYTFTPHFIVHVPLQYNTPSIITSIKNIVNTYKIAGKIYTIQFF